VRLVKRSNAGSAIVETALMMPWLVFLFMGILDFGYYSYAAICTQEAARMAAIQFSTRGSNTCQAALGALNGLPNVNIANGCAASKGAMSSSQPVAVAATELSGSACPDFAYAHAGASIQCEQVIVTYQTVPMFPIPGLTGQMTLSRLAWARVLEP
jgi:Flp pilus assembly protein TadG